MPPEGLAVIEPSLPPKQLAFICAVKFITSSAGSVIITFDIFGHPFESVTVKVYVPLDKSVTALVVCKPGCHK